MPPVDLGLRCRELQHQTVGQNDAAKFARNKWHPALEVGAEMPEHHERGSNGAAMAHSNGTHTNPAAENWGITDQVTQLRISGSNVVYPLSELGGEPTLGASVECAIKIDDPSKQVSRLHARLMRTHETWLVFDLGSKNGIHIDGVQQPAGALAPGTELGIGGVVLVAESVQLSVLRGFLARLLGWGDDRRAQVDRAMRAVRAAATRLVPLVLSGPGELVSIAASLHAHAIGRDKPFVVCDHRRREADADVRSATNISNPSQAVRAAIGGSLCLLRRRMPSDMSSITEEFSRPNPRVQLILCTTSERTAGSALRSYPADPIVIPHITEREHELDRIISEYADDAIHELGTARTTFTAEDLDWVRSHSASTLAEIEKGTRRLVALRAGENLSSAAARLGMAPVSLSRWFARRDHLDEVRASRTKPRQVAGQARGPRRRRGKATFEMD